MSVTSIGKARTKRRAESQTRRAVGYIRISALMGRQQGEDLLSDEIQRERVEAWARFRGVDVVGWYIDLDVSGRKGVKRPEFDRMIADARAGKFDTVVVYRLSRFARNVGGALSALDDLEAHGVTLVSVSEDLDTSTATGKLLRTVLLAMDEFQSDLIGESWRHVHANRRARGIAQVNTMFGYVTKGTVIVGVDEPEADALRRAFDMRASGAGTSTIADFLHREGFRSKRTGNPYIAANTIRAMLRNPVYAGLVRLPDGELVDATHEAIVSREVFDAVQATWTRTTALTHSGGRGGSLSGLLVCSGCGRPLTSEGRRYRCKAKEGGHVCPQPVAVNAVDAEAIIEAAFLARFDARRMPNEGRMKRRRQAQRLQEAARHRRRVDEWTAALDALADERYLGGALAVEDYDRQRTRYLEQRQRESEAAAEAEADARTVEPLDRTVLDGWPTKDAKTRGRALRLLVDRVDVAPAGGRGRYAAPIADRLAIAWTA